MIKTIRKGAVPVSIDELISICPAGGVWEIPCQWYDGGRCAKKFAVSENQWKSYKAIKKLLFVRAYGRM